MVPAALTLSGVLSDAGTVVTAFGGLVTIAAGLMLGIFGVRFLLSQLRRARS